MIISADDIQRLELLVKAFDWHRIQHEEYSLAECLEHLHRDYAERAGLPEFVEYGDTFVAKEVTHARDLLDRLCGTTTCQAPGCSEEAPRHWGWCLHHDLEQALRLEAE